MKAMKKLLGALFAFCTVFLLTNLAAAASADYFLKIDTIEGESTAEGHEREIDVLSFSWGVTHTNGTGGVGELQECTISKSVDKASPKLMLACASGQHIPEAVLTCRKAGSQTDYYKVTFTDLLISSYQTGGSSSDVVPTDQISFNYGSIKFEYQPTDAEGNPTEPPIIAEWPPRPSAPAE